MSICYLLFTPSLSNDKFLFQKNPLSINLSLINNTKPIYDVLRSRARVHFFDLVYTASTLGD